MISVDSFHDLRKATLFGGSFAVFTAVSREAGAILVDDPDVMVLLANFILRYGPPRGDTRGIISSSGGMNGIVADRMADIGLTFARFDESTRRSLSAVLLPSHLDNPVDMGARRQDVGEAMAIAQPIAAAVAADPNVGVVFIPLTTIPNYEASVTGILDGLLSSDKPALLALTPGSVATGVRAIIRQKGIPYCDRIDDGMRLLRAYMDYRPQASELARPQCQPFAGALPHGPASGTRAEDYLARPRISALGTRKP